MRVRPPDIVIEELKAAGLRFEMVHGRHIKFRFTVAGKVWTYVATRNENGGRTNENTRAGIKRLLRQCGAVDPEAPRG